MYAHGRPTATHNTRRGERNNGPVIILVDEPSVASEKTFDGTADFARDHVRVESNDRQRPAQAGQMFL